jgi:hypothetical protein
MLRTIRNIAISVVVLLVLFVGGGVAYEMLTANNVKQDAAPTPKTESNNFALPKPPAVNPKAAESAAVESFLSPAKIGTNTSISVKTLPGSSCTISVMYNNVPAKDSGLITKAANAYGIVEWTWTVENSAPVGTWPVKVTCSLNKKSAVVIGNLQVTK